MIQTHLEKCSECNTWQPVGQNEITKGFGQHFTHDIINASLLLIWGIKDGKRICPSCSSNLEEFRITRLSFKMRMSPIMETSGVVFYGGVV